MTRRARRIIHGLVFGTSPFVFALFVGVCGGIAGVLVDIDHLPMLWGSDGSRSFHTPLAIGAGGIAFYYLARFGGLLVQTISLKKRRDKNVRNS